MIAIRYEAVEREVGDYLDNSHVWVDGDRTDETLPGTSCLTPVQDKYTGDAYKLVFPHRYLVEGTWAADGEDDGEIILSDCRVIADLDANPDAIEDWI